MLRCYKVISYKDNIITIKCDNEQFKEGDFIRLCNFETIELDNDTSLKKQYKDIEVTKNDLNLEIEINNLPIDFRRLLCDEYESTE